MKNGIRLTVALGAVSLVAAQPALAGEKDKKKEKEPVVKVEVNCATTLDALVTSSVTATYSGTVTCEPDRPGKTKRVRKLRRNAANACEQDPSRGVTVTHTGFQIASTTLTLVGTWSANGRKPPSGDSVVATVADHTISARPVFVAHCDPATATKQVL